MSRFYIKNFISIVMLFPLHSHSHIQHTLILTGLTPFFCLSIYCVIAIHISFMFRIYIHSLHLYSVPLLPPPPLCLNYFQDPISIIETMVVVVPFLTKHTWSMIFLSHGNEMNLIEILNWVFMFSFDSITIILFLFIFKSPLFASIWFFISQLIPFVVMTMEVIHK